MIVSHIVAVAKNGVIGKNNTLPWQLPEDLKFFRDKTKGKILIMGRRTFESLPGLLKGRYHIVVSSHKPQENKSTPESPVQFVSSMQEAFSLAKSLIGPWPDEVMIAGGSEIFKASFPYTNRIYLTRIHHDVDGDVFYPNLDLSLFSLEERIDRTEPFPFSFLTYTRPLSAPSHF